MATESTEKHGQDEQALESILWLYKKMLALILICEHPLLSSRKPPGKRVIDRDYWLRMKLRRQLHEQFVTHPALRYPACPQLKLPGNRHG